MYGPQVQGPLPVLSVHRKVISKMGGTLKNRLGSPDLLVMFTDTISHKMVQNALNETRGQDTVIVRSRSSSMSAWAASWPSTPGPELEPCLRIL